MKQSILIVGAGGYIGSKMVDYFSEQGFKIIALDRFFFGNTLDHLEHNKKIKIIKDDIRSFDKSLLKGVDTIINLASISNDPSADLYPEITKSINHLGAVRLARIAKKMGVTKYIFASSCSVYGAGEKETDETSKLFPVSLYAKSKIDAENDLLKIGDKNFCITILRNATAYGLSKRRMRFDLIINLMTLNAWKNKKIYLMGGGKQWRPLIHIDDFIKAFYLVHKEENIKKISKQIFNVGSNKQNHQVYQVANMYKKFFPDLTIEEIPDDLDPRSYRVNFDKIKKILNFKTSKTIEDGINEIKEALNKGEIIDDLKTYTVKYYQYLINANSILSKIKLRNKLF